MMPKSVAHLARDGSSSSAIAVHVFGPGFPELAPGGAET